MEEAYFQKALETMPRRELEAIQLKGLKKTVRTVYDKVPFYRKKLKDLNIHPDDINSLDDLRRLPFTVKDDLRSNYPFGLSAVPLNEVAEIHASSGTTGTPTLGLYTLQDLDQWGDMMARCLVMSGMTKNDVFQITPTLGMFTGGFGFFYGARKVGATIVPASAGFTKRQIQYMLDFGTTMIAAIVSYLLRIAEVAAEMGVDLAKDTKVRKGIVGSEMWTPEMGKRICQIYNMDLYDIYGLTELCGPGVGNDCRIHDGVHLWEDHFIVEVIDPKTGEQLGPEEKGELVFTTIQKQAAPLLRYRTRDLSYLYDSLVCECGRTHRRMARIQGRVDDMIKVSGFNFWTSQVESVLMKQPEVGTEYLITITRRGSADHMIIKVEAKNKIGEDEAKRLAAKLSNELREVLIFTPEVIVVGPGELPRVEVGKAKRVVDERT
ncbi:MAG: phenylacetate--CoA ligase [Nitrososphaerales archaeon]